jgi:general secretion pathway protein F
MIGISILIVFFLMTQVVPQILSMFTDNPQQLPLMTKILMSTSHVLGIITPYLFALIICLSLYIYKKRQNPKWRFKMDQWLTGVKFYPRFIQITQIPRYLHTLKILLVSGVNVLESMLVGSQLITNLAIRQKFDAATQEVREGVSISQALQNTNWFNSITIHLIQSGEKSGQIAMMMERAAIQIDNDRQQWIDTGLKLLEPIITVFMGGFVLFIVLAILLPIFQMQQLVQ